VGSRRVHQILSVANRGFEGQYLPHSYLFHSLSPFPFILIRAVWSKTNLGDVGTLHIHFVHLVATARTMTLPYPSSHSTQLKPLSAPFALPYQFYHEFRVSFHRSQIPREGYRSLGLATSSPLSHEADSYRCTSEVPPEAYQFLAIEFFSGSMSVGF